MLKIESEMGLDGHKMEIQTDGSHKTSEDGGEAGR